MTEKKLVKRANKPASAKNPATKAEVKPAIKTKEEKEVMMSKYECIACGYIYDPEKGDPSAGIKPGTAFEDLPDDWVCPDCGAGKDQFEKIK